MGIFIFFSPSLSFSCPLLFHSSKHTLSLSLYSVSWLAVESSFLALVSGLWGRSRSDGGQKAMEKLTEAFDKVKKYQAVEKMKMLVGMEVEDEESAAAAEENTFSFMDDFNHNCTLSTKQRLYGFAICFVSGLTCTLLSMLVFFNPIKFGFTFTLGNLLSLGSTAFLIGPKRQVTMMLDPVRIYATALYLASMIIALFCALYVHSKILTLFTIILEFGALTWYSMSYIPFARSMIKKIFVSCFDTDF